MMYMPDCLKAVSMLLRAPDSCLTRRTYNITGMSFTPRDLATEIKKRLAHFEVSYKPDFRQGIAETWPRTIDDSAARQDWEWKEDFDIASMTDDMLNRLSRRTP